MSSKFFNKIIFFAKLVIGSLLASHFLYGLFIPFLNLYVVNPLGNPWQSAIEQDITNAFPYGPVMFYFMVIPRILFAWLIPSDALTVTWIHLLLARVPLLAADCIIFWILVKYLDTDARRVRLLWWASPIVIYITYVHGQLDIIPTAILMVSLALLVRRRYIWSAVVLGLGVAAKSHLLVALPFVVIFTVRRETSWKQGFSVCSIALGVYVAALFPWVLNPSFRTMVFGTDEQKRIFMVGIDYLPNLRVFLAPLFIGLLFLRFAIYKKMNQDTLLMFLGLAYTILICLLPPAHGYYLWPLPFFIYFFSQQLDYSRVPLWTFNVSCVAYLTLGLDSTLFESLRSIFPQTAGWGAPISYLKQFGADVPRMNSILFTIMQTSIFMMAFMMYRHGVVSNIIYRPRIQPIVVGIGGDSGSGKHAARDIISDVVGQSNVLTVDGDDVHKWERGHEMWKVVSHLDPEGNDLYLQMEHAKILGQGKTVNKVKYDHTSGKFTKPTQVSPSRFIFFVGLHPFYLKRMRELIDIKIYMDTDEDLRWEWKIKRDIQMRGYTEVQVYEQIKSREKDGLKFVQPQKQFADMLVRYYRPQNAYGFHEEDDKDNRGLGISVRMDNSLALNAIVEELKDVQELTITLNHEDDLLYQTLTMEGYASSQQISQIAKSLLPQLNELIGPMAKWRGGPDGILQLCFLVFLSDFLLNSPDAIVG